MKKKISLAFSAIVTVALFCFSCTTTDKSSSERKEESNQRTAQETVQTTTRTTTQLIEMVQIPAGSFFMGSPSIEPNRLDNEGPQRRVTLSAFKIGKFQVTQDQYLAVMGTNPSYFSSNPASGEVQGRRPVERVSWYDAIVFCNKLSIMEGLTPAYRINNSTNPDNWGAVPDWYDETWNAVQIVAGSTGYRLPTEAQWEYACRAGTTTAYSWGNSTDTATVGRYVWFDGNSNEMTHEVGKKQANAFSLHDMHGNVWEWCWDWYEDYSSGVQTDPTGASSGDGRVGRGGSWGHSVERLRSASRGDGSPRYRDYPLGFRVARP